MPIISVIVPCYNQAQYLDECLQSVLDQTYNDWECIIVNDGSPDNTEQIAKKWCEKDSRFKYLYKENGGLSSARNAGINKALGEYILPLDTDDYIGDKYLELALMEFESDQNVKVVYANAKKFGAVNCNWELPDFSLKLLTRENIIYCSAIYRKQDWARVGGYDINMKYGLEDWEFWISILKTGGVVKKLNSILFFYRTKHNSMVGNLTDDKLNYSYTYVGQKHYEFFIENFGTFHELITKHNKMVDTVKSKKFALDLFFFKFFGIRLLNKLDKLKYW